MSVVIIILVFYDYSFPAMLALVLLTDLCYETFFCLRLFGVISVFVAQAGGGSMTPSFSKGCVQVTMVFRDFPLTLEPGF